MLLASNPPAGGQDSYFLLRDRLTVGQQNLDLLIGVRIPVPQPDIGSLFATRKLHVLAPDPNPLLFSPNMKQF